MCDKTIFKVAGYIAVAGEDYELKKPLCKKCYVRIEDEYKKQQKEEPSDWD
jgi:hypothetical protein